MRRTVLTAASCLALAAAAIPAWAGSPYYEPSIGQRIEDPAASGVPNVPNLQGCVPWCRRDLNPCDPPLFKRADGRCNIFD